MPFPEICAIAVALAMDAFAVALASGVILRTVTLRQTFRLSWHFGLFQTLMPIAGWLGGIAASEYLLRFGPWIAFALLLFLGLRMAWEGYTRHEDEMRHDPTTGMRLIALAVATSLDALAVGLSLAVLGVSIWFPSLIIGITAFVLTAAGLHLGARLGCQTRLGQQAEILGGSVLVAIGVKILWQAL